MELRTSIIGFDPTNPYSGPDDADCIELYLGLSQWLHITIQMYFFPLSLWDMTNNEFKSYKTQLSFGLSVNLPTFWFRFNCLMFPKHSRRNINFED